MWAMIAIWVVTTVLSYVLRPKPESNKPPGVGTFDVPTAEEGREIPVLFGTRDIESQNILWYGDIKAKAIKSSSGKT
jgi:hypothetical protein